jgi:hypothetical protein
VDPIDSKWVGVHEDQAQIGFVSADNERLHPFRSIVGWIEGVTEFATGILKAIGI